MGIRSKLSGVKRIVKGVAKEGLATTLERRDYDKRKAANQFTDIDYNQWKKQSMLSGADIKKQKEYASKTGQVFFVCIDTEDATEEQINCTKQSVAKQTLQPKHVSCGSAGVNSGRLRGYIENQEGKDYWVLVIKAGNEIRQDFLYNCAVYADKHPECDICYTDHEMGTEVFLKPDYSEQYLCAYNFIGDSFVTKNRAYDTVSLCSEEYLLSVAGEGKAFGHVAKPLFTASKQPERAELEKIVPYISKIYSEQSSYNTNNVDVQEINGIRRVCVSWKESPRISVIIPNKDHADDLKQCLASLEKQSVKDMEILIVENNSTEESTFEYYKSIDGKNGVKVLYWKDGFNYSAINNFAAASASGDYYLLLNNDVELIGEDCIETMLSECMHENTGIVGIKLLYQDDTIQHGGVVVGFQGVGGHSFVGLSDSDNGYMNMAVAPRRVMAVTAACLMIKKSVYDEIEGFDERYAVAFNDVDLCMKVCSKGYEIVYQPFAKAHHYESKTRGNDVTEEQVARFGYEVTTFLETWGAELKKGDPYYNVNKSLNTMKEDRFRDIFDWPEERL